MENKEIRKTVDEFKKIEKIKSEIVEIIKNNKDVI